MTKTDYYNPVRIISGVGSIKNIKDYVKEGHWLLVTSRGFTSRGVVEKLKSNFHADVEIYVYDEVKPNPELTELENLTEELRTKNFSGIIALGGGSVIDTAKVLSVTLAETNKILRSNLTSQEPQKWGRRFFLIAIPTTSGTGAEVTPFATVWSKEDNKKYSASGENIYPDIAILDPELCASLPYNDTLYTALDATSHALESLWNKNSTKLTEILAWEALELIERTLPRLLNDLGNISLRSDMQYASFLAGLAISQTRTAIAHSISYPITMKYAIPHGLACSFTLPYLIKENYNFFPEDKKTLIDSISHTLSSLKLYDEIKKYTNDDLCLTISRSDNSARISNYIHNFDLCEIIKNSMSST